MLEKCWCLSPALRIVGMRVICTPNSEHGSRLLFLLLCDLIFYCLFKTQVVFLFKWCVMCVLFHGMVGWKRLLLVVSAAVCRALSNRLLHGNYWYWDIIFMFTTLACTHLWWLICRAIIIHASIWCGIIDIVISLRCRQKNSGIHRLEKT